MVVTAPKSVIRPVGFGGGPKGTSRSGMSRTPKCVSPCPSAWIMGNFIHFGDEVRPPLVTDDQRWRRVIFDRPGRAVFQKMDESLVVFAVKIDQEGKTIELTKTDDKNWKATLSFARPATDRLTLNGAMDGNQLIIDLRPMDREQFLVLNRGFHWVQERPFNR